MDHETLEDQSHHTDKEGSQEQGKPETDVPLHGEGEVRPQGEENAVGEVDHLHHAQDQGEAQRHQGEEQPQDQAVHGKGEKLRHGTLS